MLACKAKLLPEDAQSPTSVQEDVGRADAAAQPARPGIARIESTGQE